MRVLRRFGGAVRSVVAAALTGRRRPAVPRPGSTRPADGQNPPDPAKPVARRPRAAAPVAPSPTPARSGWLSRWFGRRRPHLARRLPRLDSEDSPFTPEAYPGLSPEACAFFNTPVEECDPETLRLVLAALAMQIADSLPAELGTDAKALFANLCDRLGATADDAGPDAPPAGAEDALPQAAPNPPLPIAEPEPADAATTSPAVAQEAAPDAGPPTGSAFRRRRAVLAASCSFRCRHTSLAASCSFLHRGMHRRLPGALHHLPARRLCYAACAGPP